MNRFSKLCIEYADPSNLQDTICINYTLHDNPVVPKWIDQLTLAQTNYPIDDPGRFYGFGSISDQIEFALKSINDCIDVINNFRRIIDRKLLKIDDQDTLNYLHHIFEVYHGLLDRQTHEFYMTAPVEVKKALANLNVFVHRCESISRRGGPRHVVTYYGNPKTQQLDWFDYEWFTDIYCKGTVYLNYVEIGKTLEHLTVDKDQYIEDDAFRPFRHYSADFSVLFFDSQLNHVLEKRDLMKKWHTNHSNFFLAKGLYAGHPYLLPGMIPLASIDGSVDSVLKLLETRQFVKAVNLK